MTCKCRQGAPYTGQPCDYCLSDGPALTFDDYALILMDQVYRVDEEYASSEWYYILPEGSWKYLTKLALDRGWEP